MKPPRRPIKINRIFSLVMTLCVRVESRQKITDTEICEDDKKERDDRKVSRVPSLPTVGDPRMQKTRVGQPCDKCADFLCIPTPVTAPRFVRPNRAGHQKKRE